MESRDEKSSIAAWLAEHGHTPAEADRILQRLERYDSRIVYQSLFGDAPTPDFDIEALAHEVRAEMQDEGKRELLRWMIENKRPADEIVETMQRLQDYDLQGLLNSLGEKGPSAEEDKLHAMLQSVVDSLTEPPSSQAVATTAQRLAEEIDSSEAAALPPDTVDVAARVREPSCAVGAPRVNGAWELVVSLVHPVAVGVGDASTVAGELAELSGRLPGYGGGKLAAPLVVRFVPEGAHSHETALSRSTSAPPGESVVGSLSLAPTQPVPEAEQAGLLVSLHKRLDDLVLIANLASPGSLHADEGVIARDAQTIRLNGVASRVYASAVLAQQLAWPPLERLSVRQIFDWLQSDSKFLLDNPGSGSLARALAALSHLFGPRHESHGLDLIHAMIGLESLLSEGTDGNQRDFLERLKLLLGPSPRGAEQMAGALSLRNRLARGRHDFPPRMAASPSEADEAFDQATHIAIAALVGAIQQMAKNGWRQLKFASSLGGA
ncbi:MAG: hypothetical protein ACOY3P_06645 [Planctomycetota bacterium]